ncbi:MAG: hypothetical protein WB421_08375 [Terriglobales bacterium]|jgi:hypothetical protein
MDRTESSSRGFTLIASLLLLCLLSGIAIGLLMMVNTEGRAGGDDLQNTMAYRSAEGAIEKMTSDLSNSFLGGAVPTPTQITGLSSLVPTGDPSVSYPDYTFTPAVNGSGTLKATYAEIQTGTFQGLYASTIPITLQATALRSLGQEVTMVRTVEVALIPVFQFGVFSDSDLGFYSSPNLDFQGRVHTNGDLYLGVSNGATLTFHDKITAFGNVIRTVLPNGLPAASNNDSGTVDILTAAQGCDGTQPACRAIAASEGSVTGAGGNPPQSAYNAGPPSWQTISQSTYNGWITDGNYGQPINTGVKQLQLPFVQSNTGTTVPQYEIIRRPPTGEPASSALGSSRLYNEAEIRVLLSDDPAELPGGTADANNIRLANGQFNSGPNYSNGVAASTPTLAALASGKPRMTYFAEGSTGIIDPGTWASTSMSGAYSLPPDWPAAPLTTGLDLQPTSPLQAPLLSTGTAIPAGITLPICSNAGTATYPTCPSYPYYTAPAAANTSTWNLLDGYLRVEALEGGAWVGVTQEWLSLGFARGQIPPTSPGPATNAGSNQVNPNAILILQELADRNGDGSASDATGVAPVCTKVAGKYPLSSCVYGKPPEVQNDSFTSSPYYGDGNQTTSVTRNNWYPINFYDTREGEVRDVKAGNNSCTSNGVMNAVEIDVGNLKRWLAGSIGTTGSTVNYTNQNGYILFFSDRRGMLVNPNGTAIDAKNTKTGDSGLEDSINSSTAAGTPDNKLEPTPVGKTESPEDVNNNGVLDNFGEANLGDGVGINTATGNQYVRMASCLATGRANWVSGARHALKLVDGSLGNLPVRPDNSSGGFTVGSENPVYIQGDYNTSAADPMWLNPTTGTEPAHAAAAVIADAVTVLSDNWTDLGSMANPSDASKRPAATTYYRVAIAAGKSINFPFPNWSAAVDYGFGTDGGVHNFIRFLEDWSGATLNYKGSLVSLYYSTYNTGTFKCCTYSVYQPPTRNYIFDPLFSQPQNLPPGTPQFRDIDNLSYQQSFTPRTN